MDIWIRHPSRAEQLSLTWRAPASISDRKRWVVGRLRADGEDATFSYFDPDEFQQANLGRTQDMAASMGFQGFPAFRYEIGQVGQTFRPALPAFLRRLPPAKRDDFQLYLEQFRIPADSKFRPMELLSVTEAKLPGDGFALIDNFDPNALLLQAVIEVEGHHHYKYTRELLVTGGKLDLVPEPDNPHDPNAVAIQHSNAIIGYVSRFQAPSVLSWLRFRLVEAALVRINGDAEKPRAFAFLNVTPKQVRLAA